MKNRILSIGKYLIFLAIGVFLLWLTLRKSNWAEIKEDIITARFVFLIPATLMLLLSHFSRAARWKILMEPLGYKPSLLNTYLTVLIGYWANLAFPRLGEVLKCTILGRYEKVPVDKLVGTIVAERAFDIVSLVAVFAITVGIQYDLVGTYTGRMFSNVFRNDSGGIELKKVWITIAVILAIIFLIRYLFKTFAHLAFIQKTRTMLRGVGQGLTSVRHIRSKGWFFFHTVNIWLMYLLSTYMGFYAMQDLSQYGIKAAFSALSFGSLGMIVPSPGGIGSYQYAVQQVLLLYGISAEKGLSLGMLIWFAQTGIIIIFGTLSFLLLPVFNRNKHEKSRLHTPQNI